MFKQIKSRRNFIKQTKIGIAAVAIGETLSRRASAQNNLNVGDTYRSETEAQVVADVDVIVAGGGTAGCLAAIAAARGGAQVLLCLHVRRSGCF